MDVSTRPIAGAARRTVRAEVLLLLAVSLGASAAYAVLDLVGRLTAGRALSTQTTTLNASQAPGRPWLDLSYQLLGVAVTVVPALFAVHLLARDHDDPATLLGLRPPRPTRDIGSGLMLAAGVGLPGIGLYLAARAAGFDVKVVPEALPWTWWTVPVLVLAATSNALLEEVVVVGYLTTRLRQLDWRPAAVIAASALLRGSYHLYQGPGAFAGNAAMGVVFALVYLRWGRLGPLLVAHATMDTVVFVGYALFGSHLAILR